VLKNKHKINIPLLILQAEKDNIVKKEGIDVLCETEDCKRVILKNSKHEIFMERDNIRNIALQQVLDYIKECRSKDKSKIF